MDGQFRVSIILEPIRIKKYNGNTSSFSLTDKNQFFFCKF